MAGGHSVAGYSVCDDGFVIDLSRCAACGSTPTRVCRPVQGGATWGDVDRETERVGLAIPGGVVSTTGVAGLTLGGGLGWLHRKYGLASTTCVASRSSPLTAASSGRRLRARRALLGAARRRRKLWCRNRIRVDAHPVGPIVMLTAVAYPLEIAGDILPAWRDWTDTIPQEVTSRVVMFAPPVHPALPPELHDRDVAIVAGVYAGPAEDGEPVMEPIRHLGAPVIDLSGPIPFRAVQSMFDLWDHGAISGYWKSLYLDRLDSETLDLVVRRANKPPAPLAVTHIPTMGGAVSNLTSTDTAFGDRSAANSMLSVDGQWIDDHEAEPTVAWVRDFVEEAELLSSWKGTYLNFNADSDDANPAARNTARTSSDYGA